MNDRAGGVLSPKVPSSGWVVTIEDFLGFREFNTSGNGFRKESSGNVDCFYPSAYVKFCMLSYCVWYGSVLCRSKEVFRVYLFLRVFKNRAIVWDVLKDVTLIVSYTKEQLKNKI